MTPKPSALAPRARRPSCRTNFLKVCPTLTSPRAGGGGGAPLTLPGLPPSFLTIEDAETLVLKTLKQVMEEKLDSKNVQLASVTKEKGFRIYTDEEMAAVVERLPAN
ncbi:proteasome component PUP2 [Verticillium dahliae VdLs.17]|uniref:Proteasome component PUP2 n=1 Tax=Verticillium dahliae (strain VdLs.17 / ATCC MYA-4575 / FGSC 10137) TaxID=498257 RepID=G2XG12_VERDV|nr:proteasome component PUP2 [Verticillium dahliae VdLs.17]EGY18831.1 proteasome component PUP2 [Verticillium dahliae VdLs.17]